MRFIAILAVIISLCLSGCGQRKTLAPLVDIGFRVQDSAGVHIVKKNDTVYGVAKDYDISAKALILKNNLHAPYTISIGQRLQLPPPNKYTVGRGDSLYTISRNFAVDMSRLSRANNLSAPYTLRTGQVLTIPDSLAQPQAQQTASWMMPQSTEKAPSLEAVKPAAVKSEPIGKPPAASGRFAWPSRGKTLSTFGPKKNGLHNDGINIAGRRGDPVSAAQNGVVAYTGDQIQGYGNLVLIKHADRYVTAYAHLDKINVVKGQVVSKGSRIGAIGSTGNVAEPQLHFEIRKGTKALNPQQYL
ncbi:MAG: peptidase M23 [Micavibrio sp.]|nr:peptidase M23 [Micavibrio sp.]|tara:strand:- start:3112 stop:4014 length:903 start_codon:yes stop_codon:yes gene_type:complete